jgi:hypothetical protein
MGDESNWNLGSCAVIELAPNHAESIELGVTRYTVGSLPAAIGEGVPQMGDARDSIGRGGARWLAGESRRHEIFDESNKFGLATHASLGEYAFQVGLGGPFGHAKRGGYISRTGAASQLPQDPSFGRRQLKNRRNAGKVCGHRLTRLCDEECRHCLREKPPAHFAAREREHMADRYPFGIALQANSDTELADGRLVFRQRNSPHQLLVGRPASVQAPCRRAKWYARRKHALGRLVCMQNAAIRSQDNDSQSHPVERCRQRLGL